MSDWLAGSEALRQCSLKRLIFETMCSAKHALLFSLPAVKEQEPEKNNLVNKFKAKPKIIGRDYN